VKPNEPGLPPLSDAEAARRALKLLAERKIVPTPETFADAFWESAGVDARGSALTGLLKEIGADLVRQSRMSQQDATEALQAAQRHQWGSVREAIARALERRPGGGADAWPAMALAILKQSDALHSNWTRARKLDSIAHVIDGAGADPALALERLRRLVESWGPALAALPTAAGAAAPVHPEQGEAARPALERADPAAPCSDAGRDPGAGLDQANQRARDWQRVALRSLRALEQACTDVEPIRTKLRGYLAQVGASETDKALTPAAALTDWLLVIEREVGEEQRVRAGLQRLLGLLCDNLGQLASDEVWLVNQLEPVRALLAGPMRSGQIAAAERRLAAMIAQQTVARRGLQEAKVALAEMLAMLLDRVGEMGSSAERFNDRVSAYQQQLLQSPDMPALSNIVRGLLDDTKTVRDEIQSSRAELAEARKKVEAYEARVSQLEHQLSEVSTLVQKDPLTGALNRRGLEQAFRVESARALRYGAPLTLAMMDLDNFKRINDALGHVAGDRALIHFVTTVHATLRPTDLTARSGGEEFAVLFPACAVQDGVEAIERLQRELARRPFQFDQQRLTLTFSAGVAQWRTGESLEQLMRRADSGLYQAKKAGKNRVLQAP
jgi:diguanylate cyclase